MAELRGDGVLVQRLEVKRQRAVLERVRQAGRLRLGEPGAAAAGDLHVAGGDGLGCHLGRGHVAVEDDRGRVERLVILVAAVRACVVRVVLAGGERRRTSRRPRY